MWICLTLVIVLVIAWWMWRESREHYGPCTDCTGLADKPRTAVYNPYVWPYSGDACPLNFLPGPPKLIYPSTPDHVPLE